MIMCESTLNTSECIRFPSVLYTFLCILDVERFSVAVISMDGTSLGGTEKNKRMGDRIYPQTPSNSHIE